jgi:Antitoxin of toxin-antitoxin stability system
MATITVEEMRANLDGYLRRVASGETLLLATADGPIAELRPVESTGPVDSSIKQPRPFGLCAGEFVVPDDFDAPLPEEVLRAFEGDS